MLIKCFPMFNTLEIRTKLILGLHRLSWNIHNLLYPDQDFHTLQFESNIGATSIVQIKSVHPWCMNIAADIC